MSRRQRDDFADLEICIDGRTGESEPYPVRLRGFGAAQGKLSPEIGRFVADLRVDPRRSGNELYRLLLGDSGLAGKWSELRARAGRRRIRLDIAPEASELQGVPWELLREPAKGYVSADSSTPFSRYLPHSSGNAEPVAEAPLRVLVAIAAPGPASSLPPIDAAEERETLERAFRKVPRKTVEATFLPEPGSAGPIDLAALEEAIRRVEPHVLHVVAHGMADETGRFLCFEHADGSPDLVDAERIREMLGRLDPQPRLVFLAACQSAADGTGALRGLAPAFAEAGVSAVVAMQDRVPAKLARDLAAKLYDRLCHHGLVDVAINEARSVLLTGKQRGAAIPVLFQTLTDGRLLDRSGPVEKTPWDNVFGDLADRLPVRGGRAWVGNFRSRLLLLALALAGVSAVAAGTYALARYRPSAVRERLAHLALERLDTRLDNALLLALELDGRTEDPGVINQVQAWFDAPSETRNRVLDRALDQTAHVESVLYALDESTPVTGVAWSSQGLATAQHSRVTLRPRRHKPEVVALPFGARTLAYLPDGSLSAAGSENGQVVLSIRGSRPLSVGQPHPLDHLALSPDGRFLAAASDQGEVTLWRTGSFPRAPHRFAHQRRLAEIVWSGDSTRFASASVDGKLHVVTTTDGSFTAETLAQAQDTPSRLALSHDGSQLVVATRERRLWLWDLRARNQPQEGIDCYVEPSALALSQGGELLAIARADGSILWWDMRDNRLAEPERTSGWKPPVRLAWSPTRNVLAVAAAGGRLVLLTPRRKDPPPPEDRTAEACRRAGRNLTWDEWRDFNHGVHAWWPPKVRCLCPGPCEGKGRLWPWRKTGNPTTSP